MRKTTMWCSALGLSAAAAAPVQAQSSVTLFGVMDVGVLHSESGGVGSRTAVSNGGLSTSRVGFRGLEDLGGGWRAGFWLEAGLNPDTGTGRATNTNNQPSGATTGGGLTFDRMAYVSLESDRWGEVRLGHDFTPTHYNSIYFDPFNANGVARAGNFTFAGIGTGPLPTAITVSNTVSYWLPKSLGGVYGLVMVGSGENASGEANENDGDFASFRLGYATGPFDVALAATRTRYDITATLGDYTHANLGASWNAGFAKFFALYNTVSIDVDGGTVRKHTAGVGAHVPVGAAGRLRFTYLQLDNRSSAALLNAASDAQRDDDAAMWGMGYVHNLSKRTALYANYAHLSNDGSAAYVPSGALAPDAGRNTSALELGLRHLF